MADSSSHTQIAASTESSEETVVKIMTSSDVFLAADLYLVAKI